MWMLWLSVLGLALSQALAADLTLTPGGKGNAVVEQVIRLIQEECIFADDRLFMRRLAHVESRDGTNSDTYATGYHGGIWKVDQDKFMATQTSTSISTETAAIKASSKLSNIDWAAVTWADLRKPLYSGLAALLYLHHVTSGAAIPTEVSAQATYWQIHYRPGGDTNVFINAVATLETGCAGVGVDLVFVLDASGSISSREFSLMKNFVEGIVSQFDVSPTKTQVGLIQYSSAVTENFALNSTSSKTEVITAIQSIPKISGGTATALALEHLREQDLKPEKGARNSIAKVGVVITDGRSNNQQETIRQAHLCKNAKITMIAIGVGAGVGNAELEAIASEPTCQHLYRLEGFSDFTGLATSIEERSCGAPLELDATADNGTGTPVTIDASLPAGGTQNCKVEVPPNGATVKISPTTGKVKYYIAKSTYPSEAFYDDMTEAGPGEIGALYIPVQTENGTLFCSIEGDPSVETTFNLHVNPGDQDWCRSDPCMNGGTCRDTRDSYICDCPPEYFGTTCQTKRPVDTGAAGVAYSAYIFMFTQIAALLFLTL